MAEAATKSSTSATHIILVHGVCHDGWCWYKVVARLLSLSPGGRSYHIVAPDLAASGVDGGRLRDIPMFRDYTGPLLDALRWLPDGEKAVPVGHSLGGLSIVLAAEEFPSKVAATVFLCAYMPDCMSPPSHVLQQHAERFHVSQLDNEMKPQDADDKLPASFMFGPQFTEQNVYQLSSKEK
ncbi:putative inactive methylesterase 20 [Miscanthus floridulus]|uniref:putative inactive methylesterase 20 n=1 Tax=Miscanthus floridulus TaxID=154761 RepID=UPI003458A6E0